MSSAIWIPLDGSEFVVVALRQKRRRSATGHDLEVQDPQKPRTYHPIVPMPDVPALNGVQMHELRAFADAPSQWDERFLNRISLPTCFGTPILYGPVVFVHENPTVALDDDMFYDLWIKWLALPIHRNIDVLTPKWKTESSRAASATTISPVTRTMARLRRTSRERFSSAGEESTKDEDPQPEDDDVSGQTDNDDEDIVSTDDDENDEEDDDEDTSDDDEDEFHVVEEDVEPDVPVARRTRRRTAASRRRRGGGN